MRTTTIRIALPSMGKFLAFGSCLLVSVLVLPSSSGGTFSLIDHNSVASFDTSSQSGAVQLDGRSPRSYTSNGFGSA